MRRKKHKLNLMMIFGLGFLLLFSPLFIGFFVDQPNILPTSDPSANDFSQMSSSAVFNGMRLGYSYKKFDSIGGSISYRISYVSYSSGTGSEFSVVWKGGPHQDSWKVNVQNRMVSESSSFRTGGHTPLWIFTNVSLGDSIPIVVRGNGPDKTFNVTEELQYDDYYFGRIDFWVLEDLAYPRSVAWYEKSTGVLFKGTFYEGTDKHVYVLETTNAPFTLVPNGGVPELLSGSATPSNGTQSGFYNFSVLYKDPDNYYPAFINVLLDGKPHPMTQKNPADWYHKDGSVYQFSYYLFPGDHTYAFECSDTLNYQSTATKQLLISEGLENIRVTVTQPLDFEVSEGDPTNYPIAWTLEKHFFPEDLNDSAPEGWQVRADGRDQYWAEYYTDFRMIGELDGHEKVVRLKDGCHDGYIELVQSFSDQPTGAFEFWVLVTDKSYFMKEKLWCHVKDGATGAFSWYSEPSSHCLSIWGNDAYKTDFYANLWYHVRLEFNCTSDTVKAWTNGFYEGEYTFASPVNKIDEITISTDYQTYPVVYIDALDYSWAPGYYTNRNVDYLVSPNQTHAIFVDGTQETAWTDWNQQGHVQYNVSGLSLGVGCHNISLVFNNSKNQWFHADVTVIVNPLLKPPVLDPISPNPDEDGLITLNWSAVQGATNYFIYRSMSNISSNNGMTPIAMVSTTTYQDTIISNGIYYYVIVAGNPAGNSSLSNCESVEVMKVYSFNITVFDHEYGSWNRQPNRTFVIPNVPIISCRMELTAYSDPDDVYTRSIHFYLDGHGGSIGTTAISPGQVRGDTINPGQTVTRFYNMSYVQFAKNTYSYQGHYFINFIPQTDADTIGYLSPGNHTVKSFISTWDDLLGATKDSWVSVTLYFNEEGAIDNTAPITANITSPGMGEAVRGIVNITAAAEDAETGVERVEFWDGSPGTGTLLGIDYWAPYSYAWNTTLASEGFHDLYVRVYDFGGNYLDSSNVTVKVNHTEINPNPHAPVLETIMPNPNHDGSIILNWSHVEGATTYYIYRNLSPITCIDSLSPIVDVTECNYQDTITSNGIYYYVIVAGNPAGNSSLSNCESVEVMKVYSFNITVFDHEYGSWNRQPNRTFVIPNVPIISCRMELTAYSDPDDAYLRSIHFYLDGRGGSIGTTAVSPGQVIGDVISPGQTVTRFYNMSHVQFANLTSWQGHYFINFIPQTNADTIGYLSPGNHTVKSFISTWDSSLGATKDSWVSVTLYFNEEGAIDNTAPITANITSPGMGDVVWGIVNITAEAVDVETGVERVEFWDGLPGTGNLLGIDYLASYSYTWNTTLTSKGFHNLYVRVYDFAGNYLDSSSVTVNIVKRPKTYAPEFGRRYAIAYRGSTSTHFAIYATYKDIDNDPPTYVNVTINGTSYAMQKRDSSDSNYTDGCEYQYHIDLTRANYIFTFECSDGQYVNSTKPFVLHLPTLGACAVTPALGTQFTNYTFTAVYTNLNNRSPEYVRLIINGIHHSMEKQNPTDVNYSDGCVYQIKRHFQPGTYQYSFEWTDGVFLSSSSTVYPDLVIYDARIPRITNFTLSSSPRIVNDKTPEVICRISVSGAGINVSSVQYAYSINGSLTPTNWAAVDGVFMDADCTIPATNGATGTLYLKVNAVPFNQFSLTENTIRFRASDLVGIQVAQSWSISIEVVEEILQHFPLIIILLLIGALSAGSYVSRTLIRKYKREEIFRATVKKVLHEPRNPIFNGPFTPTDYYTEINPSLEYVNPITDNFYPPNQNIPLVIDAYEPSSEQPEIEIPSNVSYITLTQLSRIIHTFSTLFPSFDKMIPGDNPILYLLELKTLPDEELFAFISTLIKKLPEDEVYSQLDVLMNELNTIEENQNCPPVTNKIRKLLTLAESMNDRKLLNDLIQLIILMKCSLD